MTAEKVADHRRYAVNPRTSAKKISVNQREKQICGNYLFHQAKKNLQILLRHIIPIVLLSQSGSGN
jgi:hypothetical protein